MAFGADKERGPREGGGPLSSRRAERTRFQERRRRNTLLMFVPGEPRESQALATALMACEQLLEEAMEGEMPADDWTIEDLQKLRDRLEARLVAEVSRNPG